MNYTLPIRRKLDAFDIGIFLLHNDIVISLPFLHVTLQMCLYIFDGN